MGYYLSKEVRLMMEFTEQLYKVRKTIGADSLHIISDERISFILKITRGDLREATRMSLGYILQTLDLRLQNGQGSPEELVQQMSEYQEILESQTFALD